MKIHELTVVDVAAKFESLGGGSLNANGWAFGCEFGFFQRHVGVDTAGLLRWASITPDNLRRGLDASFADIGDLTALTTRDNPTSDWCITQTTYGIYCDHTGFERDKVPWQQAARRIARIMEYLARRLIAELGEAQKLFVYRTYDHVLSDDVLTRLAASVGRHGGTLCYVRHATEEHPAFTAERWGEHLIVGYIDRFAPQPGRISYNDAGWEAVCRAMLAVHQPPVTETPLLWMLPDKCGEWLLAGPAPTSPELAKLRGSNPSVSFSVSAIGSVSSRQRDVAVDARASRQESDA